MQWMWRGVCCLLVASLLIGCGGRQGRDAAPAALARRELAAEAPVRLLAVKVTYVLDEKGGYVRTMEQRYRVLTLKGVEGWSSTGAGWTPWYLERPQIQARVVAPDGTAQPLNPALLSEIPANPEMPELYSEARVLRAPLPSVSVGSVVEETIVERTKRPFFEGGSVHYETLQSDIPRDSVELRIDVPASAPLRYEVRGGTIDRKESTAGGRRVLTFKGGPFPAIEEPPPLLPDDVPRWPHVAFGTGSSWRDLARAYGKRVAPVVERAKIPDEIRGLFAGARSDKERAERLLTWMNERVRYVSLAFGESAIIPAAPGETLKRGYGDCKDKSTLLVALLRAGGVKAHVALLRSGPGEDVISELPALNVFDHAIVYVPGKEPLWIDPTSPHARAGELPVGARGRRALVIDHGTDELVRTPAGDSSVDVYSETREVHLPEYGKGRVVETTRAGGALEQQLRANLSGTREELKKALGEYVKKTYGARELGALDHGDPTQVTVPYTVRLEAKDATAAAMNLLGGSVIVDAKVIFSWLPAAVFGEEERSVDLVLPLPHSARVSYVVHAPKDFVPKPLPKLPAIPFGPVEVTRSVRQLPGGEVEATVALRTTHQRWTPAELKAFRAGVRRYEAERMPVIELEHRGQRLISDNKLAEGLRIFMDGVKAKPSSAVAQMRLALNLVDAGFGTAARAAARKAVEAEPADPAMQSFLGDVLTRDELGRTSHAGFDRAGAIAAFRRAAELDPEDIESRLRVANLLEEDDRGRRYASGVALEEAVAEYDAIGADKLAEYDGGSYAANPAFALMYAGRYKEAQERAHALPPERQPRIVSVVGAAALSGPAAALSEVDRFGLRGEERSNLLATASAVLTSRRLYAQAAALIAAAVPGSEHAADYEARARHLRSLKATDIEKLPTKSAADVVRKAFCLISLDRPVPDELVARAARGKDGVRTVFAGLRSAARGDVEPTLLADTMAALLKTKVTGNAQVGYRVDSRVEAGARQRDARLFLIVEDGQVRLRSAGELDELGEQAFADLGAGADKRARAWLEWARSMSEKGSAGDPLSTAPWLGVYQDGKGDLRLAAAALCGVRCGDRAAQLLEQARRRATDAEAVRLDHALVAAYWQDGKKLLEVARSLLKTHPRSRQAFSYERRALALAGRHDELARRIEQELRGTREEDTLDLELALAEARGAAGDIKGGMKVYKRLADAGKGGALPYNNLAWWSLFTSGGADAQTLANAQRAAELRSFVHAGSVHTLAVVYAELGKLKEARDTLNRLLGMRSGGEPADIDWYIIGRIAEQLDMRDEARRAYGKVEAQKTGRLTTYALARRRLAKL